MKRWNWLKRKVQNMKFSRKLLAAFFTASCITLIPLGVYSYDQARSNLLDKELQSEREKVWQANLMLNSQIAQGQTIISSLVYNAEIVRCLNTEDISYYQQYLMFENILEPVIESIVSSHSNILLVKIYTDNETLKGHSRYLYDLDEWPDYGKKEGERMPLSYRVSDGRLAATCQYPPSGTGVEHVLYIELRISESLGLMLEDEKELLLLDGFGNRIFESPGAGAFSYDENMENGQKIRLDGENYFLFVNDIRETGWKSCCFVPERNLEIDVPSILRATFLILILAALLCLFMSGLLCRWLLGPLEELRSYIRQVETGNLNIEVSSEAEDEIGQLTNAFGEMIQKLNRLVNEVYRSQLIQKEAEFKMLQAQLNPHFLYNTLSFINWSAIKAGAGEIAKISRDISSFYRTALNSGKATTTVEEELLNAKSYVSIQLALHHDSFDVEYEVEKDCLQQQVICNVLQPLIENALEHGIDKKRDGRGLLRILAGMQGQKLVLAVTDNGPGFVQMEGKDAIRQESKGYGLKNVNDRIRIFYGENYGIEINSEKGADTRIQIVVPLLQEHQNNTGAPGRQEDL